MDSEDQLRSSPPKDVSVPPIIVDVQPKEQTAALSEDNDGKDTTSQGPSETEGGQTNNQAGKLENATPSDGAPQTSGDLVRHESAQDLKPQEEGVAEPQPKVQDDSAHDTGDHVENDKDDMPQSDDIATVTDSEPKKDEGVKVLDSAKQSADDIEMKEDKSAVDSEGVLPKDSANHVKEDDVLAKPKSQPQDELTPTEETEDNKEAPSGDEIVVPPKDSEINLAKKEESNILTADEKSAETATSDNETADSIGNDVKMQIPSTEINGSTLAPDETKDHSAVTVDDDAIPPKSMDTEEPPPSKRNYWADNWLLVLAIILIILTVIATIILAAIIVPILSRKVSWPMRLPGNVIPHHYVLEMRPNLVPGHFAFDGRVVITIVCINATRQLILHSVGLEIDEDSLKVVNLEGGHSPFILKADYDSENEIVIFYLCEDLTVGTKYGVHIKFKGKLAEDLVGFARVSYEKGGEQKHMALTKFESIYARKAFPCFDEPAMKATFDVNLVRWKNMTSLSNMQRLAVVERDEHWEIDMYQTSVLMSTYLVTFVVGELDVIQKGKVSIWASKDVDHYHFALNITHRLLEFYEEYLGVPYSIPKLDQVAAEKYASSGMENWGVIIYRSDRIKSGSSDDIDIARLVSHELAHQWFGNLVTMKWWDHIWLNEGFAAYFGYLGAKIINEEWKMRFSEEISLRIFRCCYNNQIKKRQSIILEEYAVEYIDQAMYLDCDPTLRYIIEKNVETTEDVKGYLGGNVYTKGAALVRMMHLMLGDEVFRRGLKGYLSDNAFSNVDQDELWRQMTKAQKGRHPLDMKKIMEPWTKQSSYPLITVTRNYKEYEATVEQISCVGAYGNGTSDLWPVPITWIDGTQANYRDSTRVRLIFDTKKATLRRLPGKETWVLVNVERLGYYRVNYDEINWELLLWQLRHNYTVIPNLNRRQLILDALFFAKLNQLSHAVALDMLTYYPFEKEEIVLRALSSYSIMKYGNMIKYTVVEKYWREFVHYLFEPIFIRYARIWEQESVDPITAHFAWSYVGLLCYENYPPCLSEARKRFQELLRGNFLDEPISYTFYEMLCGLARNATTEEWNNMNTAYEKFHSKNTFLAYTEDDLLFERWFKEYLASFERVPRLWIPLPERRWKYMIDVLETVWKTRRKGRLEEIMDNLVMQPHSKGTLEMVTVFYESHKKDFCKESRERIESNLSLVARAIPLPDAIINVDTWLRARSWKKIDIREVE